MKIVIKYLVSTSLLFSLSSCVVFPTIFSYDITLVDEKGQPVQDAYLVQQTYRSLFSWGERKTKVIPFGQSNHLKYRYWEIMCVFFAWGGPGHAYLYKVGCLPVPCPISYGPFATKETKVILSPEYQLYGRRQKHKNSYTEEDWMIANTNKNQYINDGCLLWDNYLFWNDEILTLGGGWCDLDFQKRMKEHPEKPISLLFQDYISAHKLTPQERKKHWARVPSAGYVTGTNIRDFRSLDENVEAYRYAHYDAKKVENLTFGEVTIPDPPVLQNKTKKPQPSTSKAKKTQP